MFGLDTQTTLLVLVIAAVVVGIFIQVDFSQFKIDKLKNPDSKTMKNLREFSRPFAEKVESVAGQKRIEKNEAVYAKAGLHLTFFQGFLLDCLCGLVCFIAVNNILTNIFLSFIFFFIGFVVPGQIIGYLKRRRVTMISDQCGTFMRMVLKRYEVMGDFFKAMESTTNDFEGEEPVYTELKRAINEVHNGRALEDALTNFSYRTDDKYMKRFANYYRTASEIGTDEARNNILARALQQYEDNLAKTRELKKRVSELTMEAYVMLAFVPVVAIYQIFCNEDYAPFMTTTIMGQIGTTVIVIICLLCFWFINVKVGGPLEKEDAQ